MRLLIPLHDAPGFTAFAITCSDGAIKLPLEVVTPCQTHSSNVEIALPGKSIYPDTDALVALNPGVVVGVRTADCVPVLLYAPDINAVAAVHAGWKGSLSGIVGNTIDLMASHGADPKLMTAVFGPSICRDCYETDSDIANRFAEEGFAHCVHHAPAIDPLTGITPDQAKPHIDLEAVNRTRLILAGLSPANIIASGKCTRHSLDESGWMYPSWRRDSTSDRLISCIAVNPV